MRPHDLLDVGEGEEASEIKATMRSGRVLIECNNSSRVVVVVVVVMMRMRKRMMVMDEWGELVVEPAALATVTCPACLLRGGGEGRGA